MGKVTGKRLVFCIVAILLVLSATVYAGVTWNMIFKVYEPTAIGINPQNTAEIYVGSGYCSSTPGFYKTTNAGASWKPLSGLPSWGCRSILVHPKNQKVVFAAFAPSGNGNGLFRSMDAGATWVRLGKSNGLYGDYMYCYKIISLPTTPPTLVLFTDYGVYRSMDNGTTWVKAGSTGLYGYPREMAVARSNPNLVFAVQDGGVSKSTDAGRTWTKIPNLPSGGIYYDIAIHPQNPNVLYVSNHYGIGTTPGIYKTTNGGQSWAKLNFPDKVGTVAQGGANQIVINYANPAILHASSTYNIFVSTDAGATWNVSTGLRVTRELVIDPVNPNTIYAASASGYGSGGGVYKRVQY